MPEAPRPHPTGAQSMKTSRIAAAVLVAFLSSSVPHRAEAQDDPVTIQARARFKEGVDFYDKGQFENARLAFLQAYALKKHPAVLLNLAQSSAKAGHPLEAAKYFQQFIKESTAASPAQRTDAENGLAEVRQKLGRIEVTAPAGTEITLDEKERLGTAPFGEAIDVEPGAHSLRSSSETVRVTANAGQKVQARFGGGVAVAPVPVPGPTPAPPPITTPPPETSPLTEPPAEGDHKEPLPMWPGYVGIGVAAVGLVGTIVFAIFKSDAQSKADSVAGEIRNAAIKRGYDGDHNGVPDAKGVCSDPTPTIHADFNNACTTLQQNNDKVNTNATIANVSVVTMIVGGAFAATWLIAVPIVNSKRAHSAGGPSTLPILTPYAGWGSGGFTLSGSF
jgi:hypothetical protein